MIELEDHCFTTTSVVTDSGKEHQWTQIPLGEMLLWNKVSKYQPSDSLSILKGKAYLY